jgi:pimeloyl-ACP methyl ester carboxylesterase
MTQTRRFYLDLPWGQVHGRTTGDSRGPTLLMLHQSPLSSRNYERVLPLLAPFCTPVAIDTPGYGNSDPPPGVWEVADYAALVLAVADRLGIDRFHLFGRATGAVFALATALSRPARVHSLLLHGLPVYSEAERADRLANYAPPYELADSGAHLTWIWSRIRGEYPWIDPLLATQFVRDYLAAGSDFATAYRAMWRYDLRAAMAAGLAMPILLIGGGADRLTEMHARAVALLPRAQAVLLDGATDFAAEQEPERFAQCLRAFLSKQAG